MVLAGPFFEVEIVLLLISAEGDIVNFERDSELAKSFGFCVGVKGEFEFVLTNGCEQLCRHKRCSDLAHVALRVVVALARLVAVWCVSTAEGLVIRVHDPALVTYRIPIAPLSGDLSLSLLVVSGAIPIVIPHHRAGDLILRRLGLIVVLVSMRELSPVSLRHTIFEECKLFGHGIIYTTPYLHPG